MEVQNLSLAEFLSAFFAPEERVRTRLFSELKDPAVLPGMHTVQVKNADKWKPLWLEQNLATRSGVFFVVNFGGHIDKEISRINAVFFESDDLPFDEQMRLIEGSPLEPSVIVKTRKSLHTYFLVKDFPVGQFRPIQERLAYRFKSDSVIKNESRVMRLPGFYHLKKEPVLVTCLKFDPQLRYSYDEINKALPLLPPAPPKPKAQRVRMNGADKDAVLDLVRERLDISYEKEEKMVVRCLFPEKHPHGDQTPSAVFFKGERPGFFCSACGTYHPLYDLAKLKGWDDVLALLHPEP